MTVEQLHTAERAEIIRYLEARGFAVMADEGLEEIRTAAIMEARLEANESAAPPKLEPRATPEQLRNCTFAEVVKYLKADGLVVGAHEHEDTIRVVAVQHAEELLTKAKIELLMLAPADHPTAVIERKAAHRGVRAEPEYDYRAKAEELVGYQAAELAQWAHRAKINLVENALIEAHQAGVAQERDRAGE